MAKLVHIDPRQLDNVWPIAAPFLEKAVAKNLGEESIDQIRAKVVYGQAYLLVGVEGEETIGAAIVEFVQHPNYRVAHISYISGMTSRELFEQLKDWSRLMGASVIQGYGDDAIVRLWESRYKFYKAYNLVRLEL